MGTSFFVGDPFLNDVTFLDDLVNQTGGKLFDATSTSSLSGPMTSIAEELRHVYTLGYYPSNPIQNGGRRKIKLVLQNHSKTALRYKTGYDASKLAKKIQTKS